MTWLTRKKVRVAAVTALLFLKTISADAMPQILEERAGDIIFTPQFFVCLIAGIILAIGFQILLTTLSIASGISLAGEIDQRKEGEIKEKQEKRSERDESPKIVKIGSIIGTWTILTVSFSLFLASFFAVKLSLIGNNAVGATLGLVIWASFFALMAYFEIKSVSSLVGALFSTAFYGLKNSFRALKTLFEASTDEKSGKAARKTVNEIRKELIEGADKTYLSQKIDEYVNGIHVQDLDYERIKKDLKKLLEESRSESLTDWSAEKKIFQKVVQTIPALSKRDANKILGLYEELAGSIRTSGANDKTTRIVPEKPAAVPEEDNRRIRERFEKYLRDTRKEELSPENIQRGFEQIVRHPANREGLSNKVTKLESGSLIQVLSQREDLNEEDSSKISTYVDKAIESVKQKYAGQLQAQENSLKDGNGKSGQYKLEEKLKEYFSSLKRQEINYDKMKLDLERILQDPTQTCYVLKSRFGQLDRKSLFALISNNEMLSRQDADKIIRKIEDVKDSIMRKAEKVETEARNKYDELKRDSFYQAEQVRKAAAGAAWWLFATALVSALASASGGMLALMS